MTRRRRVACGASTARGFSSLAPGGHPGGQPLKHNTLSLACTAVLTTNIHTAAASLLAFLSNT